MSAVTETAEPDAVALLRAFFDNARSGFFAEVGVKPATAGSLTWPLEASGWTGVLVEPQPDVAAFLVTARSAKVVAAACVAPDVAGEPLMLRVSSPLASVDLGSNRSVASNYTVMVATRTLDEVLIDAEAPAPLDLLTLDVHGAELDALLGFDFARWQPRLIVIADPIVDWQRQRFLRASGYRLVRHIAGSGWYVPADAAVASERWPLLREYGLKMPFRKAWRAMKRFNEKILALPD